MARSLFTVSLGCWIAATAGAGDGPGLGNLTYAPSEVFDDVAVLNSPGGHGNVAMVNGYLMVIFSTDGGGSSGDGGIEFWDVSDPRNPSLHIRYDDADTNGLREAHGFGFSNSYGADVLVAQAIDGIQFWDVTNPDSISLLDYMDLPGITQGDYTGAWWAFFQAPYVYVAGVGQGLYIVDASDPSEPVLVNQISNKDLGIDPSIVFAIGDRLVLMRANEDNYAAYDIGDPANPVLIEREREGFKGYSHLYAGGMVLTSGDDDGHTMAIHEISNDGTTISWIGAGPTSCSGSSLGKGGYGSVQDGFFLSGFSNSVVKFEIATRSIVGCGSSDLAGADEDFGVALANLVWAGNDHDQGSALIPHQAAPDTTGPSVLKVHPFDGATNVRSSTRIGVSMSDQIDLDSVDSTSFLVRPVGGSALSGKHSSQQGIVNFSPDAPLFGDTTYEVVVSGLHDWAGNAGGSFASSFVTGPATATCTLDPYAPVTTGSEVDFDAASSGGIAPLTYSWNFGDGTPWTTPSGTSSVAHTFASPGRYSVILQVADANGGTSCATTQIVHNALTPLAPSASSPIVHDGLRSYNVNPDNDSVTAIDDTSLTVSWEAPVGDDPRTLAVAPNGDLWVVSRGASRIDVLDTATGAWLGSYPLPRGAQPFAIAFAPDGGAGYVTLEATGRLLALDPATGSVVGDIDVGPSPRGIAVTGDSTRVLVTRFVSPPAQLTDPADPGSLMLPSGELRIVTASPFALASTVPLAFDPGPDTESSGRGVPNYISSLRISPDGLRALIPSKKDNVARGSFLEGQPLTFESRTRTIVSEVDLASELENLAARIDLNDRDMAQSIVFSPLGDLFFVGIQGNDLLEVRDANTGAQLDIQPTGSAPQGLALNAGATRLFVHDFLSRSVSVFDVSTLVAGGANAATPLATIPTVASETLGAQVLEGKRIFYNASDPRMSQDGYISCASCHLAGGSDGQVWDFTQAGEGLRNTIELRGRAGTGHGRVHWTANFDEIQDFENDIRLAFAGAGFMSDPDFAVAQDPLGPPKAGTSTALDALAVYVASLDEFGESPHREPGGHFTSQALEGMSIFYEVGCFTCHAGAAFRDGLRHDVGTVFASSGLGIGQPLPGVGIDTPTLKGVWATAPYFHHGAAGSLEEVVSAPGHGSGATLDTGERAALIAYLMQLEDGDLPPVDRIEIAGTALGGQVQLSLAGATLLVTTQPGWSAADVALALEVAFAAEPLLAGLSGTAVDESFVVSDPIESFASTDAGLVLNGLAPATVPALPLALQGLLAAVLAGFGARQLAGTPPVARRRRHSSRPPK